MFEIADNKIKLIAMDLDGTLTQHKSKLDASCKAVLDALSALYALLIIGAGGCERIYRQIDCYPIDIIGYYGMQCATVNGKGLILIANHMVDINERDIAGRIDRLRAELALDSYYGQPVEFHLSGVITFPMLGTEAPLAQKLVYDPDRQIRRGIYEKVHEAFPEYTVFIGGSSSFDIVPKPYNKLYALEHFMAEHGFERDEVVYFGDDYGCGGNDEHIYLSDIRFIRVDDYRDFPGIARGLRERGE